MLTLFPSRYAVDLVVSSALGADMFDCVYPTRTAVKLSHFITLALVEVRLGKAVHVA